MPREKSVPSGRQRLGKVTLYQRHGAWCLYDRQSGRAERLLVSLDFPPPRSSAKVNDKLSCGLRSLYSFEPILVADLCLRIS